MSKELVNLWIVLLGGCRQQWILDRQDVIRERQHDLNLLTEDEYQKILIFFCGCKFS
jgi:hypothetical protein